VIAVALGGCTPTAPADYVAAPDPIRLGDCTAAEANVEFFPARAIGDFEESVNSTVGTGADCNGATTSSPNYPGAQYFYSYVDGTSAVHFEGAPMCSKSIYQPAAVEASHCTSDPTNSKHNHIVHFTGGPFLGWGGGFGVAMAHLNQDAGLCSQSPRTADYCPPERANDPLSNYTLDMSKWDGVSFWARRGEQSQALLRVLVGDKFTDDDISYVTDLGNVGNPNPMPHFCERVRDCSCTYQHLTCDFYSDTDSSGNLNPLVVAGGGYYCGPPGQAPGPAIMSPGLNNNNASNTCNTTRCNDVYSAYPGNGADPKFAGRPCTPYTFRNGSQSSYCWDPATDPPPAQPDQLCGDFWTFPVHLTTEWQFFTVPFNTMYQQGWAKKAPYFDLHSVSVVRFTWDTGNVDYYIDDVRFYRAKK
jgi:hypothetical protein